MRWLINYIKSCFCKHEFELLDSCDFYNSSSDKFPTYKQWMYRCKKCGYVQNIKSQ